MSIYTNVPDLHAYSVEEDQEGFVVGDNAQTYAFVQQMIAEGETNDDIACVLGVKLEKLLAWRRQWGIPTIMSPRKNPLAKDGARARMEAMLEAGMTDEAMAEAFGVKVRTLRWWKGKWGLRQPRVMTQEDTRKRLERLIAKGKTEAECAAAMGVCIGSINMWKRRWGLTKPRKHKQPQALASPVKGRSRARVVGR